eukprot:m.102075 g.102075  ORF g.102075 m.102075 type:complete len:248 (+) comp27381_c0_seq3:84-827(+)
MVVDNLRRTLLKATGDLGDLDTIKNLPQDIHNAVLETTVLAETITTMDTSQMLPGWALAAISFISACAMTFGGVVPFIPQYLLIRRTRSCEGFNTFMCFSLLTANILRILFWFGHPFEFPLLAQSILMVVAMLFLMNACVEGCYDTGGRNIRIYDGVLAEFWKWTDYADYLLYIASFTVFFGYVNITCLNQRSAINVDASKFLNELVCLYNHENYPIQIELVPSHNVTHHTTEHTTPQHNTSRVYLR